MTRKAKRPYEVVDENFDFDTLDADFDDAPTGKNLAENLIYAHHVEHRRYLLQTDLTPLKTLIPTLPPPNTDVYLINRPNKYVETVEQSFDYIHFIVHFARLMRAPADVHISTWSMGIPHAHFFCGALEAKTFKSLNFVLDKSMRSTKRQVYAILTGGLKRHRAPYAVIQNHCKITLISDGHDFVTISGSSNITTMPRSENFTISTNPDLYRFVRTQYFDAVMQDA